MQSNVYRAVNLRLWLVPGCNLAMASVMSLFLKLSRWIVVLVMLAAFPRWSLDAVPTMAVEDIKPGMKGTWQTVVKGTEIETFNLEILGVMRNFVGPRQSIIIAEATDASQMLSGPVAGMSGSPVYIDGKLIGAYAYGFTFPKEQAIIGITPIADMLRVIEDYPENEDPIIARRPSSGARHFTGPQSETQGHWQPVSGAARLSGINMDALLKPLPTALMVSGVSSEVLAVFQDKLDALGLTLVHAPNASPHAGLKTHATVNPADALVPGAPVAAVLLEGDFSIAGIGTVTWREGDRLLAYGHSMFRFGPVDVPMATAEIVTVVRSLASSFKLSQFDQVVGTVYQDRLPAIAGAIGREPVTIPLRFSVTDPSGKSQTYQGRVFQQENFTPLFSAIGFLQSLSSTPQAERELSYYTMTRIDLEGYEPVVMRQVYTGPGAAIDAAMTLWDSLGVLLNNPFEMASIRGVTVEVEMRDRWISSSIDAIQVDSARLVAGQKVPIQITLANYHDEQGRQTLHIPVPTGTTGENLRLFMGDATAASRLGRGGYTADFQSLDDIVQRLRDRGNNQLLYVKLLRSSPGLLLEGQHLPDLPPSVMLAYQSPHNLAYRRLLNESILWETVIEMPGEFTGHQSITLRIQP